MSRFARYQLTQEDQEQLNLGNPIRINTFGGYNPIVRVKSLRNTNAHAFNDHLFEMEIDGRRLILSASELTQALQSV